MVKIYILSVLMTNAMGWMRAPSSRKLFFIEIYAENSHEIRIFGKIFSTKFDK